MELYAQETAGDKTPSKFILQIDKREAQTLLEIVDAARQANKRRSSFRAWQKKLDTQLSCFG
jgi:hypothetical protein